MRTQCRSTRVSAFRYSPLVAALACALAPAESWAAPSSIRVTNTNDSGTGSLRDAIDLANANCGVNSSPVITFRIPTGPFVIAPSTPLPNFSCSVGPGVYTPTVDGTTQAGSAPNTDPNGFNAMIPVSLDATAQLAYGGDGLVFNSSYGGVLTVTGLELDHFTRALAGNLFVKGNRIQFATYGVYADCASCSGVVVGGPSLADRNYFYGNSTGVHFNNVANTTVDNNQFEQNSYRGLEQLSVTTTTVTNNRFGNNATGIYAHSVTGATVSNNFIGTFDGTTSNGNTGCGIDWNGSQGTIQLNVISGNPNYGICLFGDSSSSIGNNKIGTDVTGNFALGNGYGISMNFCYGTDIHDNVISGNMYGGIVVTQDGTFSSPGSTFRNNKIGTNLAGNSAIGNAGFGILFETGNSTIILNNLISGNTDVGIDLLDGSNVLIKDNTIGTNAAASAAMPNLEGIVTTCGSNPTIQDNLVAGNLGNGITLLSTNGPNAPPSVRPSADDLKHGGLKAAGPNILYNRVGVVNNSTAIPNGGNGIHVGVGGCGLGHDGSGNGFLQNWVANNQGMGITLQAGVGNTLSQNTVYDNVVKNIDINNNYGGPLPNDESGSPPDSDGGPNNQQNYPDVTAVSQAGGNTTIGFNLYSTPSRTFHVEIFDNPAMPPHPAGKQYRADTFLSTDVNGFATGSFTIGSLTNFIALTATDTTSGDTSEYSPVGSFTPTPAVSMSASSLDFGTVAVGTTTAPQSVTLTSTGTANYHINTYDTQGTCYGGPVCVGGDFTCSLGCTTTTSYAPGTSCTISANFHPSTAGAQSTIVFICDNAGGRSLMLSGNGVSAVGRLTINPSTFNFGQVLVGTQGAGNDFVITNPGSSQVSFSPISISGDFNLLTTTCPGQIAANSSCTATLAFAPTLPGPRTGSFSVGGTTASLSGTGTQQVVLDLPSAIDFGSLTPGQAATSLAVTVRNSGNAVLSFSSISVSGPFTLINPCPSNLTPSASCTLTVGFNPTTVGDFTGTLTIVSNASGGSRNIPITAHSVPQPVPLIRVSPGFIGFGDRMIGTQSTSQRIQIRNEGGAPAPVDLTTRSTDFLIVGGSCAATIAPQGTCFADIVFQPGGFGGRVGQFRVNSVSTAEGQVTDLVGTGCRPFVPGTSRAHQQSNCSP